MDGPGIVYIVCGEAARTQARTSISMLRASAGYAGPIITVGTHPVQLPGITHVEAAPEDGGARSIKVSLPDYVPPSWGGFCYLDADTRPQVNPQIGFQWLGDGWDLVIAMSRNQGASGQESVTDWLWHVSPEERNSTALQYGMIPIQLQGGVWWVALNRRTRAFFGSWREEWERYKDQDQGALLRALKNVPLRTLVLGTAWNGGALIGHSFGACRQK